MVWGLAHRATQHSLPHEQEQQSMFVMRIWENIKKRLNKKNRKTLKKKAITGLELLAAGGLLTGGSRIVEKLTEDSSLQISAQEVKYNVDSGTELIKFET